MRVWKSQAGAARGFTLIEVLVALFVLAVGLLGLASLQLNASKGNAQSGVGTRAVLIAQARMEMLKSARFADIQSGAVTSVCQTPVQIKNNAGVATNFFTVTCTYTLSDSDKDGVNDDAVLEVKVSYPGASVPVDLISERTSA